MALMLLHGMLAVRSCREYECCKKLCDEDPACGVFMVGSIQWSSVPLCWLKVAPTPGLEPYRDQPSFANLTSYVKLRE